MRKVFVTFTLCMSACFGFAQSHTAVTAGGVDQPVVATIWNIQSDLFAQASPENPVTVSLRLKDDVKLSQTLVDDNGEAAAPFYLAAYVTNRVYGEEVVLDMDPRAIRVVRWIAGERFIWVTINQSSSRWVIRNGEIEPPSDKAWVTFALGHSAAESARFFRLSFENGRANRAYAADASGAPADLTVTTDLTDSALSYVLDRDEYVSMDAVTWTSLSGPHPKPDAVGPDADVTETVWPAQRVGIVDENRALQWLPLVPGGDAFEVSLELQHHGSAAGDVTLTAYTTSGATHEYRRHFAPGELAGLDPAVIFPDLRDDFSLRIHGLAGTTTARFKRIWDGSVGYLSSEPGFKRTLMLTLDQNAGTSVAQMMVMNVSGRDRAVAGLVIDEFGQTVSQLDLGVLRAYRPYSFDLSDLVTVPGPVTLLLEGGHLIGATRETYGKRALQMTTGQASLVTLEAVAFNASPADSESASNQAAGSEPALSTVEHDPAGAHQNSTPTQGLLIKDLF